MKRIVLAITLFVLVCPNVWPGVVIEMEVKDPGSTGEAQLDRIFAEGEMLRMDPHGRQTENMSVIFRDDTLWMVNHDERSCQKIDEEGMKQLSAQLDDAMKQMEAALAGLPPEQRAMMEKMMKGQMPAGMSGMGEPAPPRRIEAGGVETVGDYSCTVRTLYSGDEKVWEVCTAEEGLPGAASEAMEAFRAVSRFAEQLRESFQQGPFARMVDTPFFDMDEIGGFPVRTRTFAGGRAATETALRSIVSQDLDQSVFSVPDGYKVKNLADELNRGR